MVTLRSHTAMMPKATPSGYVLYSAYYACVPAYGKTIVDTDVSVSFLRKFIGQLCDLPDQPSHLSVGNQIINADFGGVISVPLINSSPYAALIKPGDPICQIIFTKLNIPTLVITNLTTI